MKEHSLDDLKAALSAWRGSKRHAREPVPDELLAIARLATKAHGVAKVVRATKLDRSRLVGSGAPRRRGRASESRPPASSPSFSRLALSPPSAGERPVAEIETPTGVKLRVFALTEEMLGLMGTLCGLSPEGAR